MSHGTGNAILLARLLLLVASISFSSASMAQPSIDDPSANSTLPGTSQTFTWSANGVDVERWWLYVGTSPGARNIANSGDLGSNTQYDVIGSSNKRHCCACSPLVLQRIPMALYR